MYIYSIHAMLAPQVETQVVHFFSQISGWWNVENMRSCFRILAPDNRKCSQGLNGHGRVAPKPEEVPCCIAWFDQQTAINARISHHFSKTPSVINPICTISCDIISYYVVLNYCVPYHVHKHVLTVFYYIDWTSIIYLLPSLLSRQAEPKALLSEFSVGWWVAWETLSLNLWRVVWCRVCFFCLDGFLLVFTLILGEDETRKPFG